MPQPTAAEVILTNAGLPAEDVVKVMTAPADQEFDHKPFVEKIKTNYETQLKNDPNFFNGVSLETLPPTVKKALESSQYARAINLAKLHVAKNLGFTEEQLRDLTTEEYQKLEPWIQKVAERWTKDKSVVSDKQLQQELIAERRQREELEKKYGPDYEKQVEAKYDAKTTGILVNASVVGELSAVPDMIVPAADVAKTAIDLLSEKYALVRVGDFGIGLRNKDNPELKALKPNSSEEVTMKEALTEIAHQRGWAKKADEGSKSGGGKVTVTPTGNGLKMHAAPHVMDKISQKIASEK